jgi:glycine dehydrogenase subunit 2
MRQDRRSIFEKSQKGQKAWSLPKSCSEFSHYKPPSSMLRHTTAPLPELSELDLTRHYSNLARKNIGIDTAFYPLGSCTMKLNPRVNEECAVFPGFLDAHPLAPEETVQGNLFLIFDLIRQLARISGMTAGTLLPNAGAQGEFTGALMIRAYHHSRQDTKRQDFLIPDSAHGTNPATATLAGMRTVPIKTNHLGDIDLDHLQSLVSPSTAGLMLTNPNTLGLFSPNILKISKILHERGALLYYDGANLNAILEVARPGDMGFDIMHINLHKTFSTPHGGGGPGSGPVLCTEKLKTFLPTPWVEKLNEETFKLIWENPTSIGKIASFHGNFGVYLRAYLYILLHGAFGLRRVAEASVLNANYLKYRLSTLFTIPFTQPCMHEFVAQADRHINIRAIDIAKRLLDYGVYAPTIYFPLILKECLLIEPTETESKATLDQFVEILESIEKEIVENPDIVLNAPHSLPARRLDETRAARHPILKHSI